MQYERYSQEWAIIHSYRPEVRNSPLLVSLRGGERRITRFGHYGRGREAPSAQAKKDEAHPIEVRRSASPNNSASFC